MKILHCSFVFAAALLLAGRTFGGTTTETDWSLKPSLLHASNPDTFAPALKYTYTAKYKNALSLRDDLAVVFDTAGTIATKASANSENLYAVVDAGYTHDYYNAAIVGNGPIATAPEAALPNLAQAPFSALVDVFFQARFETDQAWKNDNFTYGPHLGFTPKHQAGAYYLLPSVYIDYQRVEMLRSETYRRLGITEKSFWRLDLTAGWYYPLGTEVFEKVRCLTPVDLQFDLKYYRGYQLPDGAKRADLDDAVYYAVTVGYLLGDEKKASETFFHRYARYLYLSVGHGRQPPAEKDQTSVFVGFVIGRRH